MPTTYTSLLGLALPATGELAGTWGTTVNSYITEYLDAAVAGTQTLSTDADVTLTKTTGSSLTSTSSQYIILNCTGARTAARNITAPAASKFYVVINATTGGFAVTVRGAGPTTGVSIANGERAVVAWNGSDFVKVGLVNGSLTVSDLTISGGTANGVLYLNGSKVATSGTALTFDGSTLGMSTDAGTAVQIYRAAASGSNIVAQFGARGTPSAPAALTNGAAIGRNRFSGYDGTSYITAVDINTFVDGAVSTGVLYGRLTFSTRGADGLVERAVLNSSGNLGLGVTPSTSWSSGLKAFQLAAQGQGLSASTSVSQIWLSSNSIYNGTNWLYVSSASSAQYQIDGNAHKWFTAASGTAGNAITFTQAMTLDANGTLTVKGIGANNGNLIFDDPGTAYVSAQGSGSSVLYVNGRNGTVFTTGGTPTGGTERARITSGGELCIGTTAAATGARLTVDGVGSTNATFIVHFANSSTTRCFAVEGAGRILTGTAAESPYNNTTASAANMFVDSAGVLFRSTSSLKYKTDVQNATHGLAEVMQLRPVTYKGKNDGDTVFGGLIAEEVHAAGLTEFVQYAEDGSPDALAYGNMVSLLTKAIQEQQALIIDLRARVAALEAK